MRRLQGGRGGAFQGDFLHYCSEIVANDLAQVAFRSILNITPTIVFPAVSGPITEFGLQFDENPLGAFVELPNDALPAGRVEEDILDAKELVSLTEDRIEPTPSGLLYANVLCGAIRGALEMVGSDHAPRAPYD